MSRPPFSQHSLAAEVRTLLEMLKQLLEKLNDLLLQGAADGTGAVR